MRQFESIGRFAAVSRNLARSGAASAGIAGVSDVAWVRDIGVKMGEGSIPSRDPEEADS